MRMKESSDQAKRINVGTLKVIQDRRRGRFLCLKQDGSLWATTLGREMGSLSLALT